MWVETKKRIANDDGFFFLNKAVYGKPIANIIVNSEKLKP
jgi:hypothetical protein